MIYMTDGVRVNFVHCFICQETGSVFPDIGLYHTVQMICNLYCVDSQLELSTAVMGLECTYCVLQFDILKQVINS